MEILDIRNQALQHGLASVTVQRIAQHVNAHQQVLVFINRRGFAPVLLCHACGWMADCHACDSHLTLHQSENRQLICHHCGLNSPIPRHCPRCLGRELLPIGVGTQRVYEHLIQLFPNVSTVRIDRDEVRHKQALETQLARINSGEAQLIIGTQMLAKGHHFPRLTLVVILDADNGFINQDFRALEYLGQLLLQVAGRAGRAQLQGQLLMQTHQPHHPLLNLLLQKGYDEFARALLQSRQQAALPPFHFLALIRAEGRQQANVLACLQAFKSALLEMGVIVLGPAPAPLARKAHQYRLQLLLKSASRNTLQSAITTMREQFTNASITRSIRWTIDIDPMNLS
jgi:primosomal protein N' (replication factor Y)